jgi:subtilisin family serine protease
MKISLRNCLFLTLVFVSIFASWQGVSASYAVSTSGDSPDGVSSLRAAAPLQKNTLTETEKTESAALPYIVPPVQYSQTASDLKSLWALERIHALPLTRNVTENTPVLVAVLDTGIDKDHEDLYGKVVAEIDLSKSPSADDVYGHGTPIAGIIVADIDNNLGVMGLAPESRLINVKVAGDDGKCQLSTLAAGIIWAVDNGARVINISIEIKESRPELLEAVDYAWDKGALIIAAAGNDNNSLPVYPAACDNSIAVTAIQENGALAPLANYGDWVDVAAPGLDIYSTLPDNRYGYKHGTSFATAYVSGLAALLFSLATDTNGDGKLNDEVRRALEAGCDAIDIAGTGNGVINVAGSVAVLALDPGYLP